MGGKFSAGAYPKGFDKTLLLNIDLNWVRSKVYLFERIKRGRLSRYNDLFITQAEVQLLFKFSQRESHEFFHLMDHEQLRRIPVFDLWGALALAANSGMSDKIEFLFDLLDFNKDGFASKLDVENMFVCATRGLARLKSISPPPLKILRELITKAIKSKSTILNEAGEICTLDLKVFLISSDASRKYFSNLGTNVEVKDENKLLQQRSDMLQELMEVEQRILELEYLESIKVEDSIIYAKERGGEEQLVRISEAQMARLGSHIDRTNEDFDEIRRALTAKTDLKAQALEDQYKRRAHRDSSEVTEEVRLKDAEAFSPSRNCKPSVASDHASNISDQAFNFRWSKLHQDSDGLSKLNIDLIEDLFEASGILMTDANAQNCLVSIPTNQLGRHNREDVLAWHHDFVLWGSLKKPHFREVAEDIGRYRDSICQFIREAVQTLTVQKEYVSHHENLQKHLREIAKSLRRQEQLTLKDFGPEVDLDVGSEAEATTKRPPSRSEGLSAGAGKSQKKGFSLELSKEQLVGSVRLAAWQRQQVLNPPTIVAIRTTFGMDRSNQQLNNEITSPQPSNGSPGKTNGTNNNKKSSPKKPFAGQAATAAGGKSPSKLKAVETNAAPEKPPDPKMKFSLSFTVKPLNDTRANVAEFINAGTREINNLREFDSGHLLEYFTFEFEGLLGPVVKHFGTVSWLAFSVNQHASEEEAVMFHLACKSFFESIPWQERSEMYTEVRSELLTVKQDPLALFHLLSTAGAAGASSGSAGFSPASKGGGGRMEGLQSLWKPHGTDFDPLLPQRIVLVALLHEVDEFRLLEDQLPAGITVTRAVREANLEIDIMQDLPELYQLSFPFEYFRDRLFGPQEDELGEDGMNPLRFAKMCRKRQQAAQQAIVSAPNMSFEELRGHCKARGLEETGTKQELVGRVQSAFQRQIDMIGFGELSAFGEDMCRRIFHRFKDHTVVDDGGLTLWEFNAMLRGAGSDKVSYNINEYKALLREGGFRTDKQGKLHVDGLTSYFERFGRLGDTIQKLGIGSLDDILSGAVRCSVKFDREGFSSLLGLLSSNTVAERVLKPVLRLLSSLDNLSAEIDYSKISELFVGLKSFFQSSTLLQSTPFESDILDFIAQVQEFISSPGWLVSKLHRVLEELANGDSGIVRSLRIFLMTEFSSYANWEAKFKDHIKSWQKVNSGPVVREDEEGGDESVVTMESGVSGGLNSIHSRNSGSVAKATKSTATADSSTFGLGTSSFQSTDTTSTPTKEEKELEELFSAPNSPRSEDEPAAQQSEASSAELSIEARFRAAKAEKAAEAAKLEEEELAKLREEQKEQQRLRRNEFLQTCLPEVNSTKHLTEERFHQLMADSKRLRELLIDDTIHLNRSEREELRLAKEQIDQQAIKLRKDLEESKSICAAHACAFYDALRLFGSELVSVGWGTKEICLRGTSQGFHWANLLPKAGGELSIPLQMREGKLRRAAQRKNAALAALEREQQRRKMDEAEKERQLKENENKKDKRLGDEERLLFAEAFDLYCVAKDERQLTPTLEKMATLWENLSILKSTRYPKSLQAVVCQNNLACICLIFFSRNHPRWSDASGNLEACSNTLYAYLEDVTMTAKKAEEKLRSEQAKQALSLDASEGNSSGAELPGAINVEATFQMKPVGEANQSLIPAQEFTRTDTGAGDSGAPLIKKGLSFDMSPSEVSRSSSIQKGNSFDITPLGTARSGTHQSLDGEKVFPRIVMGVPEAQISPIILILQNHVSYIRLITPEDSSGVPNYAELPFRQRRWMERNQNLILALMEHLPEAETERVYNGIAKSVNHIPVLVHGNIGMELNKTTEELKIRDMKERQRLEDLRRKLEEEAALEAQRKQMEAERAALEEELAMREAELRSLASSNSMPGDSLLSLELAAQREEKARKYKLQREADKATRERVSKQRAKLYAMIRTDEISKVFKAHAKSISLDGEEAIHWGKSQEELKQTEVFERF